MTTHTCEQCDFPGDGNCSVCHGTGNIGEDEIPPGATIFGEESSCPACSGSGHCEACGGTGEVEVGGEG